MWLDIRALHYLFNSACTYRMQRQSAMFLLRPHCDFAAYRPTPQRRMAGGRHVPFAVTGDGNLSAVFTLPACRCRGASRLPQEQRRCALPSGGHGNPPPGCGMDTVGKGQRRAQGKAPAQGRPPDAGLLRPYGFHRFLARVHGLVGTPEHVFNAAVCLGVECRIAYGG